MALPLPVLDDRQYQDLIDGMREALPRTAPYWTDHNASDPGITLLELFAYLADAQLYRLDRVTPAQQRAFLRLLGCEPRPSRVAHALVELSRKAAAAERDLPARTTIASSSRNIAFQTRSAIHVSDARLTHVLVSTHGRWENRTPANDALTSFRAFGADPRTGDALYLGFDRTLGPDHALVRLFLIGEDVPADVLTWSALHEEARRHPRPRECHRVGCDAPPFWQHYGVRVRWEHLTGEGWRPLPRVRDYTRALSLSGPVCWRASATHVPGGVSGHETTYFIRCRVVEGLYDCPPVIRGVRFNTLLARHANDVCALEPERSTGAARQQFFVPHAPVVPSSLHLTLTDEDGVTTKWRERPDFDRSGPHARHFVIDHATGRLFFGDGRSGDVPPAGGRLRAYWEVGGGATGNVPAKTLDAVPTALNLVVEQALPAWGGADGESLSAAKARAYEDLRDERCAATLADLERIASRVPGLPVAFAYAVAERHPQLECLPAAGCVTVVIVPRCVEYRREATSALCRAVARFIERRRPLALEVHVTAARFTTVSVSATLALERAANRARVIAATAETIDTFLHPLHGGPERTGWKVGRAVYRSEVLAVLQAVAGVRYVSALTLTSDTDTPAACGDIIICANGLVASGTHVFNAI